MVSVFDNSAPSGLRYMKLRNRKDGSDIFQQYLKIDASFDPARLLEIRFFGKMEPENIVFKNESISVVPQLTETDHHYNFNFKVAEK